MPSKFFVTPSHPIHNVSFEMYTHVVHASASQLEIDNNSNENDADGVKIDQGINAIHTVMDLKDEVDSAITSGNGLSEPTVRMIQVTMESVRRSLGARPSSMPSMESFSNSYTPTIATEGFVQFIKDVWNRIVEFFKKIFGKVQETVEQVKLTEKTLKTLYEETLKVALVRKEWKFGDNPKLETKLAEFFSHNGAANKQTVKTIWQGVNKLTDVAETFFKDVLPHADTQFQAMLKDESGTHALDLIRTVAVKVSETLRPLQSCVLPLDLTIDLKLHGEAVDYLIKNPRIVRSNGRKSGSDEGFEKEIELLNGHEIVELLNDLKQQFDAETRTDVIKEALSKFTKQLDEFKTLVSKALDGSPSEEKKIALKKTTTFVNDFKSIVVFMGTVPVNQHLTTLGRTINYARLSLRRLKNPNSSTNEPHDL